jgi:hypothetical protein
LCRECKIIAICLYSLLSLVAFVGNSLVVAVIVHFRRLHTPTNMLIVNLAVADLMISILCMPLSYWHVIIFEGERKNGFFVFQTQKNENFLTIFSRIKIFLLTQKLPKKHKQFSKNLQKRHTFQTKDGFSALSSAAYSIFCKRRLCF